MRIFRLAVVSAVLGIMLLGCAVTDPAEPASAGAANAKAPPHEARLDIDVPYPWGGEARCMAGVGCFFVAVEHEESAVVLYQFEGRTVRLLDRQALAYHPDSVIWVADDLVAVAVETSFSLDVFKVENGKLNLLHQIPVGFEPRDVVLVRSEAGRFTLLATPYSGKDVAWVEFDRSNLAAARVHKSRWCEAPWHPVRLHRAPGFSNGGMAAACLDDKQVMLAPLDDLFASARSLMQVPVQGYIVPRYARSSPSGRWLYVALETGARNLRFNLDTQELQWIRSPRTGAVSVLPLEDDVVIWGDDQHLYLQRLDGQGQILETRWLDIDGLPTSLQLQDVDGDGEPDLIVLNSSTAPGKKGVNVLYGPLWDRAEIR